MAKNKNSNKGLIFGTVLGAVAGAAYALWKTPMSGQELRSKLSPGPLSASSNSSESASNFAAESSTVRSSNPVLGAVERTLAPLVGVELGKTANNGGNGTTVGNVNGNGKVGESESVAVTEPVAIADAPADAEKLTVETQPTSIRAQRWAWGSPAPESNVVEESVPSAPESTAVEANLPEAAPLPEAEPVTTASGSTQAYGTESIRAKRFAWGDPAPEAATAVAETDFTNAPSTAATTPEQSATASMDTVTPEQGAGVITQTVDSATSGSFETPTTGAAGVVDDAVLTSAVGQSTGKFHAFPNLGGLEN